MTDWLTTHFLNQGRGYDWQNEVSVYEKRQTTESMLQGGRTASTARVISRHELVQALDRSDREAYLSMLVKGFLNRQYIFDPTIDISSVLRRYNSGLNYADSFRDTLGLDNSTYELKDPNAQMVQIENNSVVVEEQFPVAPLAPQVEVRSPQNCGIEIMREVLDKLAPSCDTQPHYPDRDQAHYTNIPDFIEGPTLNRGLEIDSPAEVDPNLIFEEELDSTQTPEVVVIAKRRLR